MPEEFKQNVPVDVQRIFAPKGNQMSPPGINQNSIFNQNDFMLSGCKRILSIVVVVVY